MKLVLALLVAGLSAHGWADVLKGRPWTWDTLGMVPLDIPTKRTPLASESIALLKAGDTQDAITTAKDGLKKNDLAAAWVYVMSYQVRGTIEEGIGGLDTLATPDKSNLANFYALFKLKAILKATRKTRDDTVEKLRQDLIPLSRTCLPLMIALAFDGNPSLETTRRVVSMYEARQEEKFYLLAIDCRNLIAGRIHLDDKMREIDPPDWESKELVPQVEKVKRIADQLVKTPNFASLGMYYRGRASFEARDMKGALDWFKKALAADGLPKPLRIACEKFLVNKSRSAFNRLVHE